MNAGNEHITTNAIRESLIHAPRTGMEQLLSYAENKGKRSSYFESVILKSQYYKTDDPKIRAEIIANMINIAADIEKSDDPLQEEQTGTGFLDNAFKKVFTKGLSREVVVECKGIMKRYKGNGFRLNIEHLQIQTGTITGLVGENANGKSTLLKVMAGIIAPDRGDLSFPAIDKNHLDWKTIKSQLGYLPQEIKQVTGKVIDSLRLSAVLHGLRGKQIDFEVDYLITRLGINDMKNSYWSELSGGFKLKFALARILVSRPKLMLLDEPLANLDINAQQILLNDLRNLSKSIENPIAIIISSQSLEEVEAVADYMIMLKNGTASYQGLTSDIGKNRKFNSFEIRSSLNRFELEERFLEFGFFRIEQTALSFIITTPVHVTIKELMRYLSAEDIPVSYIADISNSTKKIFLQRL